MRKKLTQEEFIERAKLKHTNRFDYLTNKVFIRKRKIRNIFQLKNPSLRWIF